MLSKCNVFYSKIFGKKKTKYFLIVKTKQNIVNYWANTCYDNITAWHLTEKVQIINSPNGNRRQHIHTYEHTRHCPEVEVLSQV